MPRGIADKTTEKWKLIHDLVSATPMNQKSIAASLGFSPSTVSRIITKEPFAKTFYVKPTGLVMASGQPLVMEDESPRHSLEMFSSSFEPEPDLIRDMMKKDPNIFEIFQKTIEDVRNEIKAGKIPDTNGVTDTAFVEIAERFVAQIIKTIRGIRSNPYYGTPQWWINYIDPEDRRRWVNGRS